MFTAASFILFSVLAICSSYDISFEDNQIIYENTTTKSSTSQPEVFRPPGSCLLPEHPEYGSYASTLCHPNDQRPPCHNIPGTPVPSRWLLRYFCHDGYQLTSNDYEYSECDLGNWKNPLDCVRTCPPLDYSILDVRCEFDKQVVSCDRRVKAKTTTTAKCKDKVNNTGILEESILVCQDNGTWSQESFNCTPASKAASRPTIPSATEDTTIVFGCTLPEYPKKGFYFPPQCGPNDTRAACGARPGEFVPHSWLLKYTCKEGYMLSPTGTEFSVCDNGIWLIHLDCVPRPSLLTNNSTNSVKSRRTRQSSSGSQVEGSCQLPPYPANGVYVSVCQQEDCGSTTPGAFVRPFSIIKYSCNASYNLTFGGPPLVVCSNGVWGNLPECTKQCQPLKHDSLDIKCTLLGREVPCDQPMQPNTRARASCKQHYVQQYSYQDTPITCGDDGHWSSQPYHCIPICGVSLGTNPIQSLIRDGTITKQGDFPWLAALYMKNDSGLWEQQCGGTLITSHIVLTAAHCFFDKLEEKRKPEDVKVGLGKYKRDYYTHESSSKIYDVRELLVPQAYSSRKSYYALDIGLIDLAVDVQVTGYIMPACLEWNSTSKPNNGEIGLIAGWGRTENTSASDVVLSTQLKYINFTACNGKLWNKLGPYLTTDKFCGETFKGGQVDRGDSGGGMTFLKNGLHTLYGVVSTKVIDATQVSLFTDIKHAEHMTWLISRKTYLDEYHLETQNPTPDLQGYCRLPQQPKNGNYLSKSCQLGFKIAACYNIFNSPVPHNWTLEYSCDPNFTFTYGGSPYAVCNNGHWENLQECDRIASECTRNEDCPAERACISQRCQNPCQTVCGKNTFCHVSKHYPLCTCYPGYVGNPFEICQKQDCSCANNGMAGNTQVCRKKTYYVETSKKVNWFEAFTRCQRQNGRLAAVTSKQENDEIVKVIRSESQAASIFDTAFWIGGSDLASEGNWTWMSSTGQRIEGYTNWYPEEPNNYQDQDCLSYWIDNKGVLWSDLRCIEEFYFVCEY